MTTIALFGAGGKMGVRLSKNLMGLPGLVRHVEPGAGGRQRLPDELGSDCTSAGAAVDRADVVILAVPDSLIGRLAYELSPQLKPGTMVMSLDAAATVAGRLPQRADAGPRLRLRPGRGRGRDPLPARPALATSCWAT